MGAGHYFDERPGASSARRAIPLHLPDLDLQLITDRGVFSGHRVDLGTLVLLRKIPPPTGKVLLDLGCGYGPIALSVAHRSPQSEVWAVDVNERAIGLTAENAASAGLANVRVALPDEVPDELRFDAIYSNPPIRIGKDAMHELLSRWLSRLSPEGTAWLVVQRNLGSDSLAAWLARQGYPVSKAASSKGYRVLAVSAGGEAGELSPPTTP